MTEKNIKKEKFVPDIMTPLKQDIIALPNVIRNASGIRIFGRRIKSIIYTTDVAIIKNTDADAILGVYPFTPENTIIESISNVANVPVFSGIGGGITNGERSADLAIFAEARGSIAVVLNAPANVETIKLVKKRVDIPIVYTVVSEYSDIDERIRAGVDIFNVSGGKDTIKIIKKIRDKYPQFPIIATGGNTEESILATIEAGANAITYTPELAQSRKFQTKMEHYRIKELEKHQNDFKKAMAKVTQDIFSKVEDKEKELYFTNKNLTNATKEELDKIVSIFEKSFGILLSYEKNNNLTEITFRFEFFITDDNEQIMRNYHNSNDKEQYLIDVFT